MALLVRRNDLTALSVIRQQEARHESASGTFRTRQARLTMSAFEGKADFPVARPDFSV
jgi:hypothetical protein